MSFQPPVCEDGVNIVKRRKRQVVELTDRDAAYDVLEKEETIKVSHLVPLPLLKQKSRTAVSLKQKSRIAVSLKQKSRTAVSLKQKSRTAVSLRQKASFAPCYNKSEYDI